MKNNLNKSYEDYKQELNNKYTTKLKLVKSSKEEDKLIEKHQKAKKSLICRFFNL